MIKQQIKIVVLLLAVIFLVSCQERSVFSEYQDLNPNGWKSTENVEFKYNPDDITSKMELQIL